MWGEGTNAVGMKDWALTLMNGVSVLADTSDALTLLSLSDFSVSLFPDIFLSSSSSDDFYSTMGVSASSDLLAFGSEDIYLESVVSRHSILTGTRPISSDLCCSVTLISSLSRDC